MRGLVLIVAIVGFVTQSFVANEADASPCTDAGARYDAASRADNAVALNLYTSLTGRPYVPDLPISSWHLPFECQLARRYFTTRISQMKKLLGLEQQGLAACETFTYTPNEYARESRGTAATIAADQSDLAQINALCRAEPATNKRKRGGRRCEGIVQHRDFATKDGFCVTIVNGCGFSIDARLVRSDGRAPGTFAVGSAPVTQCSDNRTWKYIFQGYSDRGTD